MLRLPPTRPLVPVIGMAWLSLLPLGCSLALDASRVQCQNERDCTSEPGGLAAARCVDGLCEARPEWSCVNGPGSTLAASSSVDVALPVVDLLARDAAEPIEASLCRKLDVNCEAPTQSMTMSGTGDYPLSLERGFEGYLSVRGGAVVPTLYFLSQPLEAGERLPTLTLLSEAVMGSLAAELGVPLMEGRGLALFSVQDCDGALTPGIALEAHEADAETTRYYDRDGLPTVPAAVTGAEGSGGFLNAPPGPLSVEARLPDGSAPLASASVLVRPGFISYGRLRPALGRESAD
jgi:hypothetical protein